MAPLAKLARNLFTATVVVLALPFMLGALLLLLGSIIKALGG